MKSLPIILMAFLLLLSCGDLSDPDCSAEDEYEEVHSCKNDAPGGCKSEPVPTYSNTTCDTSSYSADGYDARTFMWCCLDGRYVSETWERTGKCWSKSHVYKTDGICSR